MLNKICCTVSRFSAAILAAIATPASTILKIGEAPQHALDFCALMVSHFFSSLSCEVNRASAREIAVSS
jgi:hypothetical protein